MYCVYPMNYDLSYRMNYDLGQVDSMRRQISYERLIPYPLYYIESREHPYRSNIFILKLNQITLYAAEIESMFLS